MNHMQIIFRNTSPRLWGRDSRNGNVGFRISHVGSGGGVRAQLHTAGVPWGAEVRLSGFRVLV